MNRPLSSGPTPLRLQRMPRATSDSPWPLVVVLLTWLAVNLWAAFSAGGGR